MINKKTTNKLKIIYKTINMPDDQHDGFRKEGLDFLKHKFKKTTDDFIKDTYPKKDYANMRVKISRLINKDPNSPHYFGALELARDLSKYFNKFRTNGDHYIAPMFFLGESTYVDIIGASYSNAQVGLFKKSEIKKIAVPTRYNGYQAITSKNPISSGMIRLFKPRKLVSYTADNMFSIAQDKKTRIIWVGFIEPKSNGKYDILDKSSSTGKTIQTLADNIDLSWSSRIEYSSFPQFWDY